MIEFGILINSEHDSAVVVLSAPVLVALNAERVIQQIGGHTDLPVWSLLTQLQVESACPLFPTSARAPAGKISFSSVDVHASFGKRIFGKRRDFLSNLGG
jgi:hypothetical protein